MTPKTTRAAIVAVVGLLQVGASMLLPMPIELPRLGLFVFALVQALVLLVAPLVFVRVALGMPASELGLALGEPRKWLREAGALFLVALPVLVWLSRDPSIRAVYPTYAPAREQAWLLAPAALASAVYLLAWEFPFRGLMQLGTRDVLGRGSVLLQLVPFVASHAGKPAVELALSVVSGLVLGALAHRHRTLLPGWLLHLACATTVNALCLIP